MGSSWTSSSPRRDLEGEIQVHDLIRFPLKIFPQLLILYAVQLLLFYSFLNP